MEHFTTRALGLKEISPATLNFKRLYTTDTLPTEPILIVISPGADPSQELQEVADSIVGNDHYHQVAMGQGQAGVAIQLLRDCAINGEWLCLKNLHLVTAWLPTLEKELNALEPHENFRLWLTTESHPKFLTILLQSSLKVTYEAPPGIRKNLERTYDSWSQEYIAQKDSVIRSQALFALAWFHAVVQERRCYIPQGWSKFYEFSLADMRAAASIIDRLCRGSGPPQWDFMHGLMENAVYGGRVDNMFDMRVLQTYLRQCFDDKTIPGQAGAPRRGGRKWEGLPFGTIPVSTRIQDFQSVVSSLPETDRPSFFGLPANIERSSQRTISSRVISQLKVVTRRGDVEGKFDQEAWAAELSPLLNLWKKLNQVGTHTVSFAA